MNDLGIWIGRKDKALGLRDKQKSQWEQSINLYNCIYFNKIYGGLDPERVDVHFVNFYVTNLVPLTYFRDPFIFVKPRNDRFSAFAETQESAINYVWKELGLKQQFKKVILSAFLMPPGWMKLGYTAKIGQDVANIEKLKEKTLIQKIKQAVLGTIKEETNLTPEEQGVLDMNIEEESVFASWIPSWNILMPPGYHEVNKMPWLIEIEDIPMIDFKRNPFYKNKSLVSPTRNVSDKEGNMSKPTYSEGKGVYSSTDDENEILRLYHTWDRREQKRLTFSDQGIHFEGKWPYDMDGFPYKPLVFEETLPLEEESNPYPVNAVTPILPQVIEQSQARTMMVKHRKRANVYILVPDDLTEEHIGQLEENEAVQIIRVPRAALSTQGGIQSGPLPQLPPDVFRIDDIIKQDLQMGTNMGQMMFQAQTGQRTATQAQIGQQGLQLKSQARVDVVEDYTVVVARAFAQLMWQFYDREKISEVIGQAVTPDMWPDLPDDPNERRHIIHSELQFKIDAGSTAPPKDETVDRKQFLDALSIAASIAPERLRKDEALKIMFKTFKYVKDLDKIVISGDDEQIQVATLENELMLNGAPQVVSPDENHMIHIGIHSQAKGNPLVDTHIIEHGQKMGIQPEGQQTGTPQEGDIRPPKKSSNPEITRQGISTEGDINQSTQNLGVGTKPRGEAV